MTQFIDNQLSAAQLALQMSNFLLTCQHPGLFGVGCIKANAVLIHQMAITHHDCHLLCQLIAQAQGLLQILTDINLVQPIIQQAAQATLLLSQHRSQQG